MKNVLPPLIGVLVATLAGACTAAPAAQPTHSKACSLTVAEKTANAHLSFDDFDQKGVTTGSGRSLGSRGCWEAAAAATEDYILHGPDRTDGEQRNLLFHLAQMRALAGDEREAARLIVASRQPQPKGGMHWNAYVEATWAFLVKDRQAFDQARAHLTASDDEGDRINSGVLAGLAICFAKSYRLAYEHCRPS